jgi:hypothetical protein
MHDNAWEPSPVLRQLPSSTVRTAALLARMEREDRWRVRRAFVLGILAGVALVWLASCHDGLAEPPKHDACWIPDTLYTYGDSVRVIIEGHKAGCVA